MRPGRAAAPCSGGGRHDGRVSTSWSDSDTRTRPVSGTAFGRPYALVEPASPPVQEDVKVGLLTLVVTVLVGAPVGLAWAAVAPHVKVVVVGQQVNLVEAYGDGFIAADAYFLAATLLAGVLGGLIAWRLAAAHGPVVVFALTGGGLIAAYVAMTVGEQVGLDALRSAVRAGGQGMFELNLELKSQAALVGWPLGSLLAYLGASLARGR